MKIDVFNKVVKEQLLICEHLLTGKGHEYAPDAVDESNIDRLAHFKKAAAIIDGTPKEALLGMLGYVYRRPQLLSGPLDRENHRQY
jgi:hypothetical protein